MKLMIARLAAFVVLTIGTIYPAVAAEIEYPQMIKTHYEAVDQKTGGSLVIFSERESIVYGLDTKIFPGTRFVEATKITPMAESITLTFVAIRTVASPVSDYIHLTGNDRFPITGTVLKSSNFPPGSV